jgi:hypothetical protein
MNADEPAATVQPYRTLRVTKTDEGVLSVVIDAPPMNLIGPELVHDLVTLIGELESVMRGAVRGTTSSPRAPVNRARGSCGQRLA